MWLFRHFKFMIGLDQPSFFSLRKIPESICPCSKLASEMAPFLAWTLFLNLQLPTPWPTCSFVLPPDVVALYESLLANPLTFLKWLDRMWPSSIVFRRISTFCPQGNLCQLSLDQRVTQDPKNLGNRISRKELINLKFQSHSTSQRYGSETEQGKWPLSHFPTFSQIRRNSVRLVFSCFLY